MSKFERKIKYELNSTTPNLKEKIKANANMPKPEKTIKWQYVATPMIAVMVLLVAIITPIFVVSPGGDVTAINNHKLSMAVRSNMAVTTASADNDLPSVQIVYNSEHKVTKLNPLNKNGLIVLSLTNKQSKLSIGDALVGQDVDVAIKCVIDTFNNKGFLKDNRLEIFVENGIGTLDDAELKKIEKTIKGNYESLELAKMSKVDLDMLEDDIEENPDKYYNLLKDDIRTYLNEKDVIITDLVNNIFNRLKTINPQLEDMFDEAIEDMYDNSNLFTDSVIIELINNYPPKYKHDLTEDVDINNMTSKEFYDIYDDIIEEYKEVKDALTDIKQNKIPDDIDDMLEDILRINYGIED